MTLRDRLAWLARLLCRPAPPLPPLEKRLDWWGWRLTLVELPAYGADWSADDPHKTVPVPALTSPTGRVEVFTARVPDWIVRRMPCRN